MALISFVSISSHLAIPAIPCRRISQKFDSRKRVRLREYFPSDKIFGSVFPLQTASAERNELQTADYFGQKSLDYNFKTFYLRHVYEIKVFSTDTENIKNLNDNFCRYFS